MPRYIDADRFKQDLINKGFYPAIVKNAIENAPTEDVVPRSELEKAKQEVAMEIFDAVEFAWETTYYDSEFRERLANLRKKYIGE